MKRFNVTGTCFPNEHYMVDIGERVAKIEKMVERGDYFCINAGRQYGKTTTLNALKQKLEADYCVFSISFESLSDEAFGSLESFGAAFIWKLAECIKYQKPNRANQALMEYIQKLSALEKIPTKLFTDYLSELNIHSTSPIVLIIDEVDQAGNFPVFIKFLGLLRDKYLNRRVIPTFQSIILAGVYDIRNLKLKMRPEVDHQYNSPWNIAAKFDIDLALPANGIERMIAEYKRDHAGVPEVDCMDAHEMAQLIFDYTSGYPFLVSRLCQILDEKQLRWDNRGLLMAEKELLIESNTLFDDMIKKLDDFPDLSENLQAMLYEGESFTFNPDNRIFNLARMFGYVRPNENGKAVISNRIFETRLYNYFSSLEETSRIYKSGSIDKSQFVKDGQIDMEHLITRFGVHFNDIYGKNDDAFVEKMGRKLFLLYLKPIINGIGNYYIEAQTRDETRTDVVIDYLGRQYIIELKIWRGNAYNERGEEQIAGYLDYFHAKKGYLVSFCFNKCKSLQTQTIQVGDKTVFEAVV